MSEMKALVAGWFSFTDGTRLRVICSPEASLVTGWTKRAVPTTLPLPRRFAAALTGAGSPPMTTRMSYSFAALFNGRHMNWNSVLAFPGVACWASICRCLS